MLLNSLNIQIFNELDKAKIRFIYLIEKSIEEHVVLFSLKGVKKKIIFSLKYKVRK